MSGVTCGDVCRICSQPCSRSSLLQHLEDYHRVNLYDQYVLDTIYEVAVSVPEMPYRPQICLIAGPPKENRQDEAIQYVDQGENLNYSASTINLDETPQPLEEDMEAKPINGWNDQIQDEDKENNDDNDIKIKAIVKPLRHFEVDVQPTMNGEEGGGILSQYYGKENQPCEVEEKAAIEQQELPQQNSEVETDEDLDFDPSQMFSTRGKSRRKRKLTQRAKTFLNGMTEDQNSTKKRKFLERGENFWNFLEDQSCSDGDGIVEKNPSPKKQDLEVLLNIQEISNFHLEKEKQKSNYQDLYSAVKKRNRKPTEKAQNYFKQIKDGRDNKEHQSLKNDLPAEKQIDERNLSKSVTPKETSKRIGKPSSRLSEYILFPDTAKNKSPQCKKGKNVTKLARQKVIYKYIEDGEDEIVDFVTLSNQTPLSSKNQDVEGKKMCDLPETIRIDESTSTPVLKNSNRRNSRQTEIAKVHFEEIQESTNSQSRTRSVLMEQTPVPTIKPSIRTLSNQKRTTRRISGESQSYLKEENEISHSKTETQASQDIFSNEVQNYEESLEVILRQTGRQKLSSGNNNEEHIEVESTNNSFCLNPEEEELASTAENVEDSTLISCPDVLISKMKLTKNVWTKIMSGETITLSDITDDDTKVPQVHIIKYDKKVKLKYSDEQGEDIKNLEESTSDAYCLSQSSEDDNNHQLPDETLGSGGVLSQNCSPVLSTTRAKPNKKNYLYLSARKGRYMCPKSECQFNHISRELVKMHLHDSHNGEGTPKQQELALYFDRQEIANYINKQHPFVSQKQDKSPSVVTDPLSDKQINEPRNVQNDIIENTKCGQKSEAVNFEDVFHLNKNDKLVKDFAEDLFCCQIISGNGRYRCPVCDFHDLSRQVVKNHLKMNHKNGQKISPIHQELSIYLSQCVKERPFLKLKYADDEGQDIKDWLIKNRKNMIKTSKIDINLNTSGPMEGKGHLSAEADNEDLNNENQWKGEKQEQYAVNETLFVNVDEVPYSDSIVNVLIPKLVLSRGNHAMEVQKKTFKIPSVLSHSNHAMEVQEKTFKIPPVLSHSNHAMEVQKKTFKIPPLSNETLIAVAVRNLQLFHFQNPNEKSSPSKDISNKGVMSRDMAAMLLVTFPAFGTEEQIKNGVLLLFWDDDNPQRLKKDLISKLKKKFHRQKEEYRKELLNSMLYPQLLPSLESAFEDHYTHPSAFFKPPYNDVMLGQLACYALVQPATVKQLAIILGLFFPSFKANAGDWILLENELFAGEEFQIVEVENQPRKYKLSEEKAADTLESLQNFTLANIDVVEHSIVDKDLLSVLCLK